MPQFKMEGHYAHSFPLEMAAAYMFHIIKNHPFVDGNKRTGIVSGLTFLKINEIHIELSNHQMMNLAVGITTDKLTKEQAAIAFFILVKSTCENN